MQSNTVIVDNFSYYTINYLRKLMDTPYIPITKSRSITASLVKYLLLAFYVILNFRKLILGKIENKIIL